MKITAICLCALLLIGCGQTDDPPVVGVEADNQAMNQAMATAQATLDDFFANYQSMPGAEASLKFGLETTNGDKEHIWFNPIAVNGDTITAQCANQPVDIPGLALGDVRELNRSQVSDWLILVGNTCYGGYTMRVMAELYPEQTPPFEFADL